ncbi:MAG: VWA domain-containing protein [Pseudomonadota bacterium]
MASRAAAGRRGVPEFSVSFLDVICCGFGAIILLLMITKTVQPIVLERTTRDLDGIIAEREQALFEIRGQVQEVTQQLNTTTEELDDELDRLARLEIAQRRVTNSFQATQLDLKERAEATEKLAAAKQSLTEEMQRLLGAGFRRQTQLVGGIPVDSEYIIFVIDTSGSMYNGAWPAVLQKVRETLSIYPKVQGIQVMNDMGDYMFTGFARRWIPDSPARREAIIRRLANWNPFSNSSPVEGIEAAIDTYYDPNKRISIYVFGDDFTGTSIQPVVDRVDRVNSADANGRRRVRIHAVAFPVYLRNPSVNTFRFAALMRELAFRNDGTFVGITRIN